jgi:hypothetical protein
MGYRTKREEVQIITRQGEVKIKLEIDINVNAGGAITVHAEAKPTDGGQPLEEVEENVWEIPDFGPTEKLEFGKQVKENE